MNRKQIEEIAEVCHEANRVYSRQTGDSNHEFWDYTSQEVRDSAFNGVLRLVVFPKTTPEGMHESWMKEKLANGWTYGETKNFDTKTHPCLVPYSELPEAQKKKDALFQSIARALLGLDEVKQ